MGTLKAPFNFVPLSEKVFFPEWADQISQDIPFEDGVSGKIELKITAESPIFVRNGHSKADADDKNDNYKSFSKTPDDQYFIPSTSIKGAVRNVLEIMSFGKMSQVSNNRYSIRDLQLKKYLSFFQAANVHCGWMSKEKDKDIVTITDNGIPRRLSYLEIDSKLGTNFSNTFVDATMMKDDSKRSALYKIKQLKSKSLKFKFKEVPLNPNNAVDTRIKVHFSEEADAKPGTIVVTGQPGVRKPKQTAADGTTRKKASGKFYEFVFFDEYKESFQLNTEDENGLYKDFCFVYKDSDEWKYWRTQMENGEKVPVFFSIKDGKLLHFGLSYLYKLPYVKRIKEYLYDEHKRDKKDLCECIFGYTDKQSLRGRVQFSNALCTKGEPYHEEISPYMGSPKPTYYPIYLKQSGNNGYMVDSHEKGVLFKTMLDSDAKLRGWKRYPIQKEFQTRFAIPAGQEKNTNPFYPMSDGSEFICNVRFHNLKKVELGGLLNSLQLRENYFHSIGFAKAYGFGKIKIEITNISGVDKGEIEEFKKDFIECMSNNIQDYSKSPQLKELNAMMREQNLNSPLEYMELKDFVTCKKQHFKEDRNQTFGEYLQDYTSLIRRDVSSQPTENQFAEAEVTYSLGSLKQAKLKDGKNQNNICLNVDDKKAKFKIGERIQVKKNLKGGNVVSLDFIKKI